MAIAQRVFVNTPNAFYELNGGAGNCSNILLTNECAATYGNSTFSMAVYKDTIYYLSGGVLRSFQIGMPGTCKTYLNVGNYTSMTVDPNGILYFASNVLVRYDPYLNQLTNLGAMPFSSAGDLVFFNGKMLMAGIPAAIYEVNIANPGASTLYMNTDGIGFFGLVSFPVICGNSRYFGLAPSGGSTVMYELDLLNKTVIGNTCSMPGLNIYDAGSTTESGVNAGITISSLQVTQPCPPVLTGSVSIQGFLAGFTTTYTLDNTIVNSTGIFSNVPTGPHTIRLEAGTCITDTVINIAAGLNPVINIQKTDPDNCDGNNGTVTLSASTGHLPITYTQVASGMQQQNGTFGNLQPGTWQFNVKDAAGCSKDTFVTLVLQPAAFVQRADFDDARCGNNTGFIKLVMAGGDTTGVQTSLAGAAFLPKVSYYNLAPGVYNIKAKRGAFCFYDTTILISNITDPKPSLSTQVQPQVCFVNNGSISITATAPAASFQYQLNGGAFSSNNSFANLAPGNYLAGIRNQYGCFWDTTLVVLPYTKAPVFTTVAAANPDCSEPSGGTIRASVTGVENPYRIAVNGNFYANGQLISGLTEGMYNIKVLNRGDCVVDSSTAILSIQYEARCNNVFIPSAFTPNGDGRNDFFRPVYSSFIRDMRFQVYNRYGQRVYLGNGYGVQWDGTFKGVKQAAGSYIYFITYADYFGVPKTMKGSFLMIR